MGFTLLSCDSFSSEGEVPLLQSFRYLWAPAASDVVITTGCHGIVWGLGHEEKNRVPFTLSECEMSLFHSSR